MKIAIFGASGQGREVADICSKIGYTEIIFLVSNENEKCVFPNKVIVDTTQNVEALKEKEFDFAIGIGSPAIRREIATKYTHLNFPNIIHPSVTFGLYQKEQINKSRGNIITAGVRFTNNIKCGNFCLFNLNVTVAHDSIIGNFVSVMADVNISGNVYVCDGVYLGVDATILQGNNLIKLTIGEDSIVGACALVTKDIPPGVTVIGIPARISEQKK